MRQGIPQCRSHHPQGSGAPSPMASRFSIEGLAASSARHPWRVILIWLLILAIGGGYALTGLNDVLSNEMTISGDVETLIGSEKLQDTALADEAYAAETIVLRS